VGRLHWCSGVSFAVARAWLGQGAPVSGRFVGVVMWLSLVSARVSGNVAPRVCLPGGTVVGVWGGSRLCGWSVQAKGGRAGELSVGRTVWARGCGLVAIAGAVVLVAGCGGGGEVPLGMSTVTADPTPSVTPTPTPTPSPTSIVGVVQDMSLPELGIVFDAPPLLSGDEADVYNWIATYKQEYWRTLKTNEASSTFDLFVDQALVRRMEEIAANNTNDGSQYSGVFHVRISDISVDGDTARGTTCDDYTNVTIVEPDGPVTLEEAGALVPRLMEVTLVRNGLPGQGFWAIMTSERIGEC
jgi:hypothetical protein